MAFLANVDDSILPLGEILGHRVEKWPASDLVRLVASQREVSTYEARVFLFQEMKCLLNGSPYGYVLTRSIEVPAQEFRESQRAGTIGPEATLLAPSNSLWVAFARMRLAVDGNVCAPFWVAFADRVSGGGGLARGRDYNFVVLAPFRPAPEQIEPLKTYLANPLHPIAAPHLMPAHLHLELAYQVPRPELAFIALVIGIEALFWDEGDSVKGTRSRIGTRLARLLGEGKLDRKRIQRRFEELYGKRVGYVHRGETGEITGADITDARSFLRRSLRLAADGALSRAQLVHGPGPRMGSSRESAP